jgi:hypothetical protein
MGYCILRVAKIKSRVSLARSQQHNTRERMPDNADPDRSKYNVVLRTSQEAMEFYSANLPEKVRKNAVHAAEVMVSVPPDSFRTASGSFDLKKCGAYLSDAAAWLAKRLGGVQNRINLAIHVDERSPHLHLTMMPLRDGKLNYKSYLGGHRDALVQLQTDFAKEVGAKYDLERGIPRAETGRRHITVGKFYALGQDAVNREIRRQHMLHKASDELTAKRKQAKERGDKEHGR